MKEIWKDIPGFENLYQVSNLGRVKSLPKLHNLLNNNVNNLEWCTPQENVDYMIKLKRNTRTKQWLNKLHDSQEKYYKSVKGTDNNGNTIILKNINEAKNYGMSPGTICACCKKIKNFKTYRGYTWEYVE